MRIAILLVCCFVLPAHAEIFGLPQLMHGLAQVQTSQAKFVERKILAVLDVPLTSSGILSFRAPDHLEKHTLEPRNELLVLDQGVLTIENKARDMKRTLVVQQYPAVWALVESIRSTLAGDLPMLQRFYTVELNGDAAKWRMKLLPKKGSTRDMVKEIVIHGQGGRVNTIEMREANGDASTMTIIGEAQ